MKWEYEYYTTDSLSEAKLIGNKFGSEGFELVQIIRNENRRDEYELFFKRPLTDHLSTS